MVPNAANGRWTFALAVVALAALIVGPVAWCLMTTPAGTPGPSEADAAAARLWAAMPRATVYETWSAAGSRWQTVSNGMPKPQVRALLGEPSVEPCQWNTHSAGWQFADGSFLHVEYDYWTGVWRVYCIGVR